MVPTRRSVLKSVSAGVAGSAVAGTASGECSSGNRIDANQEYQKPSKVNEVTANHRGFLQAASNQGLLTSPEVNVSEILDLGEYLQSEEGAHVWPLHHPKAVDTTLITIRRKTPAGHLTLSFAPELTGRPPVIYVKRSESVGEAYRPDGAGQGLKKRTVERSGERATQLDQANTQSGGSTDDVTTQGITATFCVNRGDYSDGCGTYSCYAWEGECSGSDCSLYECTGSTCCGGCCCCEDVDYCCEVCGDGCSPCDDLSIDCPNGGCSGC